MYQKLDKIIYPVSCQSSRLNVAIGLPHSTHRCLLTHHNRWHFLLAHQLVKRRQIGCLDRFELRELDIEFGGELIEAGDMVVHRAYMIHTATTNQNPHGRMRLSTDIRYQRRRDEIDLRWQNPWSFDDML